MATSSRMGKALAVISLVVICSSFYRGCLNHNSEKREHERGKGASRMVLENVAGERKECVRTDESESAASRSDDARNVAAMALLLKAMAEAKQAQHESTCQSMPRLDPGIAAMMNYKSPYSSSSSSRSSSSDSSWPSWKCRYCGSVAYGPAPMPNSGRRCAGRELGPDPGPCVYDKN